MSRTETASYWCYRCTRFVGVTNGDTVVCRHCHGGFIEAVDSHALPPQEYRRPFPAAAMYMTGSNSGSDLRSRRGNRRNNGDRSPFNPVIVLRGLADGGATDDDSGGGERGFELYYDDGAGSGLQPLPTTISEFLMASGFDRLLDQLSPIELARSEPPPASKSAVESLPTIEISDFHVNTESHCAVCTEAFVLEASALEMPCKHIYHSDCILPWLNLRNSCPVCRHELPTDSTGSNSNTLEPLEAVGLTIWRLPGGGFAVGRFNGGGERELPVVYTEMEGGFNENSGTPRRIVWESRTNRVRRNGGIGSVFRNMFSLFGRLRPSSNSSNSNGASMRRSRSLSSSVMARSRIRTWLLEEQNGM